MKLKKLLSLLVVLAISCSFFAVNVAAAEDDFAILRALGISTDFSDDTTPMTRYELAKAALEITGNPLVPEGTPTYPDIPEKHKYFPVINGATVAGLMGANMDGTFSPEAKATGMDAGRVLLAELGYAGFAQQAGWTELQYISKVKSLGLTSGIDTTNGVTPYALGKMVVNMLTTKVMEAISIDSDGVKYAESTATYIEQEYGYILKTGILQAAGETSISGYAPLSNDKVTIDGIKYKITGGDYTSLVGFEVKYILTSRYPDAEVLFIGKDNGSAELTVDAQNIYSVEVTGGTVSVSYLDENENSEKVSFSKASTRVVVNGQNIADTLLLAKYLKPDCGSVSFIDTDLDDDYDIVHVNTFIYAKVGGVKNESFTDQLTKTTLDLTGKQINAIKNGASTSLADIEIGTYVEVAAGDVIFETVNGNEIIKPNFENAEKVSITTVATETISGVVKGLIGLDEILIDGTTYKYSPYFVDLRLSGYVKAPTLNSTIEFVVNENKEIIDIIGASTSYSEDKEGTYYGYMSGMNGLSDISDQAVVSLVDLNILEEVKYITAEDCKLNGKDFKYQELANLDYTGGDGTSVGLYYADGTFKDQIIRFKLNDENEISELYMFIDRANEKLIIPETTFTQSGDADDNAFFAAGEYNKLKHPYGKASEYDNPDYDSEYIGYDLNNFTMDYMGYAHGFGDLMNEHYYLNPTVTTSVKIPLDPVQKQDLRNWSVVSNPKEFSNNNSVIGAYQYDAGLTPRVQLFDVNEKYEPALIVRYMSAGGTSYDKQTWNNDTRSHIVTDVIETYDENEGEIKTAIHCVVPLDSGVTTKILLPTANDLPMATGYKIKNSAGETVEASNLCSFRHGEEREFLWSDIEVGDILTVSVSNAGLVTKFSVLVPHEITENDSQYGYNFASDYFQPGYYRTMKIGYVTESLGVDGFFMNLAGPTGGIDKLARITPPPTVLGGGYETVGSACVHYPGTKIVEAAFIEDVKVGDRVMVYTSTKNTIEIFILRTK